MAEQNARAPGRLPSLAFFYNVLNHGLAGLLIVAAAGVLLFILGQQYNASRYAYIAALYIFVGSLFGYLLGGISSDRADDRLKENDRARDLAEIDKDHQVIIRAFLSITILLACLYLIFYFLAMTSMSDHSSITFKSPVDNKLLFLSAVTIGAFGFFSVRYASYVKMTKRLETALRVPEDQRSRGLIEALRDTVFRDEHLYEPPGNLFVTIGITATFLGLAVALVILDLPSLLGQVSGGNSVAAAADQVANAQEAARQTRALASLTAFVGCMGLALGMSMLGVMTAMAAQWLRGLGANRCTEDLLAAADSFLAAPAQTGADSKREPERPPPLSPGAGPDGPDPEAEVAAYGDQATAPERKEPRPGRSGKRPSPGKTSARKGA